MKVIGTAGHIDHGKSALVERLTGINPDRLDEERRRGMTIDLGFASLTLPSGTETSIVDVPGHERFIKNMLAGAGGIDVALLVIAADEGVMPQTREHLDILHLLAIPRGVVALTKSDLVDGEWLDLVREEVAELLDGTRLAGAPIITVSSITGEGIEELRAALDEAVLADGDQGASGLPFLPVDRVFTVAGFGAVVTGTLHGGEFSLGQEIEVSPGGRRGRIRSLQSHGRKLEGAVPGSRVAINLGGLSAGELIRGDTVHLPGTVATVRRFDARVHVLPNSPAPLSHDARVSVHLGSAERSAIVSVLLGDSVAPGDTGWIQLRLAKPVAAIRGERFILRLPAPLGTIAGGQIVDVRPRHPRHDRAALARLGRLAGENDGDAVLGVLADGRARTPQQIALAAGLPLSRVSALLERAEEEGRSVRRGHSYLDRPAWEELRTRARTMLDAYHDANPLRSGMPKEELRGRLRVPARDWAGTVSLLAAENVLRDGGAAVSDPDRTGGTSGRREDVLRVLALLRREPYAPPSGDELLRESLADRELLAAMEQEGQVVRIGDGLYLATDAYGEMVEAALDAIDRDGGITVATLRDRFATSRKYALAFLEHLDGERITRRVGDSRVRGSRRPACA